MASTFWMWEFRREQIPELVKGEGVRPQRVGLRDLRQIGSRAEHLVGVWRADTRGKLPPLPGVILGSTAALQDLVAWTSTYVPGLCPLSGLVRLMTIPTFDYMQDRRRSKEWGDLAGGAVGLMYGEVMSYVHLGADIRAIDIDMCRGTLSYALMRSIALGGCDKDIGAISKDWITLRRRAGLSTRMESCDLIVEIARNWEHSGREGSLFGSDTWPVLQETSDLFTRLKAFGEFSIAGSDSGSWDEDAELTAEQRVRIFDEVAKKIVEDGSYGPGERGRMLAQLTFWCRRGLANQWAILQPFQARLPECAIWLGALQAQEPVADTLFVGRAVGWKLASELFREIDLFESPDEDVSYFEMSVGQLDRQWHEMMSNINRDRIKVGLAPGVSTHVKVVGRSEGVQRELPMAREYHRDQVDESVDKEELKRLQKSLERTLRDVRRYLRS